MHRDKKLGLALGILLIGAVGAFFFRNERVQTAEIPQLEDQQAIDEQILEQDGSLPYLEEIEPVSDGGRGDSPASGRVPVSPPGRTVDPLVAGTGAPPDPITPAVPVRPASETSQVTIPIPVPTHDQTQTGTVRSRSGQPSHSPVDDPSGETVRHHVKSGETLTGLANRYLGSSARFMELYEANRDQLKSPNDLRAGITIRIPTGNGRTQPSASSAATADGTTTRFTTERLAPLTDFLSHDDPPAEPAPRETTAPADSPRPAAGDRESRPKRRRFVPVRRNPLNPGQAGSRPPQSAELPPELRPTYRDPADVRAQENRSHPNPRVLIPDELPLKNGESADGKPAARTYTVRRGDSLEKIALRFYGQHSAADKIFAANRVRLKKRDTLREGMTIVLP